MKRVIFTIVSILIFPVLFSLTANCQEYSTLPCQGISSNPLYSQETNPNDGLNKLPANGTVIVWENGNYLSPIREMTGSNKTHVAIVLYEENTPYVYEAARPDVHRYTLGQYLKILKETEQRLPRFIVHFLSPNIPYNNVELVAMKNFADSKLGKRFGVASYLSGRREITIHCSEYVGDILSASGRLQTKGSRETPQSIYDKATKL
jgi:hypothetical protein